MSIAKILKELNKSAPEVKFIRQSKYDVPAEGAPKTSHGFAGVHGKEGIRFLVPATPLPGFVHGVAREIAKRLIRGDQDEQGT